MHRIEQRLDPIVRNLIREKAFVEFYIGRNGDFDTIAASIIKRARREPDFGNSALSLVLPYPVKDIEYYEQYYDNITLPIDKKVHFKNAITARNKWMVDRCDLLIAYVEADHGGAYTAMQYAEKKGVPIKNLALDEPVAD